jgi:uncharacterized membrane protein YeaQ/YmgE (transglycosylase-associated protein family)
MRLAAGRLLACPSAMSFETFLVWIVIGAISGWLASAVVGGGYGLVGDIIVGVIGAFLGSALFSAAHWRAPFAGIAGTIFVAFIGAVILLLLLRLIVRVRGRALL